MDHCAYFHHFNGLIKFEAFFQEEAYIEFLLIRRVPLQERKCVDDVADVVPQVKKIFILITSLLHVLYYHFFINFFLKLASDTVCCIGRP